VKLALYHDDLLASKLGKKVSANLGAIQGGRLRVRTTRRLATLQAVIPDEFDTGIS
jgi:hypothetical protein